MIDLKTLNLQQLNLVLHNINIYNVRKDKKNKLIEQINKRNK